jgi:hypothetical protein
VLYFAYNKPYTSWAGIFFFYVIPATSISCPFFFQSCFCLSLQTCNTMSLLCQNEELPQFCCLVPAFEPCYTCGHLQLSQSVMLIKPNKLYSVWPLTCKITGGPFKSSSLADLMKTKNKGSV